MVRPSFEFLCSLIFPDHITVFTNTDHFYNLFQTICFWLRRLPEKFCRFRFKTPPQHQITKLSHLSSFYCFHSYESLMAFFEDLRIGSVQKMELFKLSITHLVEVQDSLLEIRPHYLRLLILLHAVIELLRIEAKTFTRTCSSSSPPSLMCRTLRDQFLLDFKNIPH